MHVKTLVAAAFCAPVLIIAGAGTASAGEVTGPPGPDGFATGKPTPIVNYMMHSICAFSGLNAYHPGKEGVYSGHVQNYGTIVADGGKAYVDSPGDACNGHTGELASP